MANRYCVWKACPVCGEAFRAERDYKSRSQIYCSSACYGKTLKGRPVTAKQKAGLACGWKSAKGRPSPLKGIPRTAAIRAKISAARKGRPLSTEHKEALKRPHPGGQKTAHWNWQGGKATTNRRARLCFEAREWRRAIFERDGYACSLCRHKGRLNAHHIIGFAVWPEGRYSLSNGVALCLACHRQADSYVRKVWKILERFSQQVTSSGSLRARRNGRDGQAHTEPTQPQQAS
jgi:hypothetical protein